MRRRSLAVFLFACLVPAVAHAQATLAGVVRDSSDAILPGVTVEAASPALIQKVRTAVTDGTGQYRAAAGHLHAHGHPHRVQYRETR